MKESILIANDNEGLLAKLYYWLHREGFDTYTISDSNDLYLSLKDRPPRVIMLGTTLGKTGTQELCRQLKSYPATEKLPIILVGSKKELDCYEAKDSVDACLKIPCKAADVVETVVTIVDNIAPPVANYIKLGLLGIDTQKKKVYFGQNEILLREMEYLLLVYLASQPGVVKSREAIIGALHNPGFRITPRTVDVHIRHLRSALGKGGAHIKSVYGKGYMCTPTRSRS